MEARKNIGKVVLVPSM